MNKKMKVYKSLLVLLMCSTSVASDGTQILYSINMPGNPFQQPFYQMMIKADNENRVYPFSAANQPQLPTFNACYYENGCGSGLNNQTMANSDYVSVYAAGLNNGASNGNNYLSIMYGLIPYVFRGYTEGAASKLYMQRPAQVQLPFNPLVQIQNQNGGAASYVNATLPDYSDVFLAQTAANIYQSLGCSTGTCDFSSTTDPLPSWYTYVQRKSLNARGVFRGFSAIFYGTMSSLSKASSATSFSP